MIGFEISMTIIIVTQLIYNVFNGLELRKLRKFNLDNLNHLIDTSKNLSEFIKLQTELDKKLHDDVQLLSFVFETDKKLNGDKE